MSKTVELGKCVVGFRERSAVLCDPGLGMWYIWWKVRVGYGEVSLLRALKTIMGSVHFILEALGNICRSEQRK